METLPQPEKAQKSLSGQSKVIIGLATVLLVGLALNGLVRPLSANAIITAQNDPVLAQMETVYAEAILTEDNAKETYYLAAITRCEQQKALAQYKIANLYETSRTEELRAIVNTLCIAGGF